MTRLSAPLGISRQTFNQLDAIIRNLNQGSKEFQYAMDVLVELLAKSHQAFAMKKSAGPLRAGAAWTIPVRRLTSDYYRGWTAHRIAPGVWEMFNTSREAIFIEYGINPRAAHPIPRRILKTSAIDVLRFVQRTRVAERFSEEFFKSLRNDRGQYRSFRNRLPATLLAIGLRPVRSSISGPEGQLP